MGFRRAHSGHDALAHTRDDGFLARAADQTVDVRARTVTRALARSSMPSFAMAATTGVSMTFGVTDICTASQHVTARQVNGARLLEAPSVDVRALRRNQRVNHAVNVAAGQEVRFQLGDVQRPDPPCSP